MKKKPLPRDRAPMWGVDIDRIHRTRPVWPDGTPRTRQNVFYIPPKKETPRDTHH